MPVKYVKRYKPKYGKTYRRTYVRKGVTAKLVKNIIHSENEKKYIETLYTFDASANQFTYSIAGDPNTYNAPVLINFWNLITSISVG